ncbi:NAD(P)/FAD-dependent oxidoreductase [Halomonas aquatica]|uniref:FAD-dependent oxidoreductase n=1 Tax=Halomonas aquatica TaxID=3151123 RepID=A0ABV1NEB4_9GAMM
MKPIKPDAGRPHLLLVGAGHAHLHLIRHRERFGEAEVTLVDPGGFWYSGMASGLLGGRDAATEGRLDPARLAARYDVMPIRGRLASIDPQAKVAQLEDGRELDFSLLSLNLGSITPTPARSTPGPHVWSVKPFAQLAALRHCLEREFSLGLTPRMVVVGGGASGVEVACQLSELARRFNAHSDILLVTRGEQLLEGAPKGAVRWLMHHLSRLGITVKFGLNVFGHAQGGLTYTTQSVSWGEDSLQWLAADHVVYATGLVPPELVERLHLPLIPGRGLAVEDTLQSPGYPDIFAIGDCAALMQHMLPRLIIHDLQQTAVLLDNLEARLSGKPLRHYVPQQLAVTILDLGSKGLAIRGRRWWGGRLAVTLKRWLDRQVLRKYQA